MAEESKVDLRALLEEVKELRKLRAEVQHLKDRQEILDVLALYGRAQDRKDWKIFDQVFHPDGIFDSGVLGEFVGPISELANRGQRREYPATLHSIANHLCDIDGDTAHAETYAITYLLGTDGKTVRSSQARYVDRLEKRNGKWKIALRRIVREFVTRVDCLIEPQMEGKQDRTDLSYERPLRSRPLSAGHVRDDGGR